MSILRGTLRDDTLRVADAFGSGRWDRTPGGEVDRRISSVYDKIWRRILNANKQYRVSKRTPVSDANGRYLLSDLNGSSGDTLERFYRVLIVFIGSREYEGPVDLARWAAADLGGTSNAGPYVWYQEGQSLNALPMQVGTAADAIWVNWLPQRPAALTADTVAVDFPDGYDDVLITLSAARLLMKGGAETQASRELHAEVEEDYQEMLQDLARIATKPLSMTYTDGREDWAG